LQKYPALQGGKQVAESDAGCETMLLVSEKNSTPKIEFLMDIMDAP
jgi:hypothetical protein